MYGALREWLKGGAIDDDQELRTDLISRRYAYKLLNGRDAIVLEPKEAMKQRGLQSPDDGDALALTFAFPVQPHARAGSRRRRRDARAGQPGDHGVRPVQRQRGGGPHGPSRLRPLQVAGREGVAVAPRRPADRAKPRAVCRTIPGRGVGGGLHHPITVRKFSRHRDPFEVAGMSRCLRYIVAAFAPPRLAFGGSDPAPPPPPVNAGRSLVPRCCKARRAPMLPRRCASARPPAGATAARS
jgi:hypothetical protein